MSELELSVDEMNEIFRKSFGFGFKCNYKAGSGRRLEEGDEPNIIARAGWVFDEKVGWIGDENHEGPKDGSVITSTVRYGIHLDNLRRYAKVYRESTGRKASIRFPF